MSVAERIVLADVGLEFGRRHVSVAVRIVLTDVGLEFGRRHVSVAERIVLTEIEIETEVWATGVARSEGEVLVLGHTRTCMVRSVHTHMYGAWSHTHVYASCPLSCLYVFYLAYLYFRSSCSKCQFTPDMGYKST